VTLAVTPALPPLELAQAKPGRVMVGGVGGLTGGWEKRGPEAMGSNEGTGVEVVLVAGLADGPPSGAQAAMTRQSRAATVSRTGE
jgi:hypothetical protein